MTVALVMATIITGCAGVTHVVPTGPETYMIASHGTMGWSSGPAQRAAALEKASAYCKGLRKQLDTISATDTGAGGFGKISGAEVNFRCVALTCFDSPCQK